MGRKDSRRKLSSMPSKRKVEEFRTNASAMLRPRLPSMARGAPAAAEGGCDAALCQPGIDKAQRTSSHQRRILVSRLTRGLQALDGMAFAPALTATAPSM